MRPSRIQLAPLVFVVLIVLCPALASAQTPLHWRCTGRPEDLPAEDPRLGEVPLPGAAKDWNAFHLFTSDTWRLHAVGGGFLTHPDGSPEVVAMDENGRCIILQGDSGKWSASVAVENGESMSAWAVGDLDPRVEGEEFYVGGRNGAIYRVSQRGRRDFDAELIATLPDVSLSRFALGDLDPSRPGNELLALSNNGPVHVLRAKATSEGFEAIKVGDLGSRNRDSVVLPSTDSRPPCVAALLASGEVALLTLDRDGMKRTSMCQENMSIARMGRRPSLRGEGEVVYVARVDGLILRFAETADGAWAREPIYAGPNGPRGLAAGRFCADRNVETLAVSGYSKKVQMLSRERGKPWRAETIFTDTGGVHWLAAVELDGRNATDELVGGGFSYHVFMLARKPGYGLGEIAVDPDGGIPTYLPVPDAAARPEAKAAEVATPAVGSLLSSGAANGALLASGFEEDPDGAVPAAWTIAETNGKGSPASWRVLEDETAPDGRKIVRIVATKNRGHTFNLLLSKLDLPADVQLDVCVRPQEGKEDQGGGLVWRAKDAGNYYVVRWNPLESNLRIYKVENSVRSMFESCTVQCDPTTWHRLSVVMRGNQGSVLFDGTQRLTFQDETFPAGGKVGLWTKADAATSFDGFVAQPAR